MNDRPPARAAVVVIHGIGQQPGAATLGSLAQGLVDHAGASQPSAHLHAVAGSTVPLLRMSVRGVEGQVDLFEYSWQHLVQGRISAAATVRWAFGALLAPLQFRRNWRMLSEAGPEPASAWLLVMRQLAFATCLLLPLACIPAGVLWFVTALLNREVPAPLSMTGHDAIMLLLAAGLALLAVLQLTAIAADGLEALRINRRTRRLHGETWFGLHGRAAKTWRLPAMMAVALAAGGAWLLARPAGRGLADLTDWLLLNREYVLGVLLLTAALLGSWRLIGWLRDYVGDIALYVTADRQPAADRGRHAIKTGAARLLQQLLRNPDYDRVVLVGHSLGSVIALDALNLLARRQRTENRGPAAPSAKLAGLLTFGSPLDKVAYFFREHTGDSAAIHAQLLSYLHSTGRRGSGRDDGPYRLAAYRDPLAGLRWINLHAAWDPVSDPLVFYRVSERLHRSYFPFGSHGRYWRDPVTYRALLRLLG